MKFSDEGIIISQKKYGENSLIIKIFSKQHGIYRGFVKSAKSSKSRVIFQIGNLITFEHLSRVEESLGSFSSVDLIKSYCSKIIFDKLRLDCIRSLFSIIDSIFLERESHDNLFIMLNNFLQKITSGEADKSQFIAEYIRLELKILETIGYGIDLSSCAATESTENLVFVSPKSARAVCFSAGEKYQNKLLKLPSFLIAEGMSSSDGELIEGLQLSGFFLNKFLFAEKNLAQDQSHFFYRNSIVNFLEKN